MMTYLAGLDPMTLMAIGAIILHFVKKQFPNLLPEPGPVDPANPPPRRPLVDLLGPLAKLTPSEIAALKQLLDNLHVPAISSREG